MKYKTEKQQRQMEETKSQVFEKIKSIDMLLMRKKEKIQVIKIKIKMSIGVIRKDP